MIITRTPFRISFFGGGTDYKTWYSKYGGAVLSTTINKYCYISSRMLPPFFEYRYLIRYRLREEKKLISEIEHPAVRACLEFMRLNSGIEMVHTSDIPARSGVGSSSAFTVGFLHSLYALAGKIVTKRQLAREAIFIEQEMLRENVGIQDQIAVAFGGFNKIEFGPDGKFNVVPITLNGGRLEELKSHLLLFFTGISRTASEIAAEQIKRAEENKELLTKMCAMVDDAVKLLSGGRNIIEFGEMLNEAWEYKRKLSGCISNELIDGLYAKALKNGAVGGKILGAGGGGFLLIFAAPKYHDKIKKALGGILYVPFNFESLGSQVIFYSPLDGKLPYEN